MKGFRARRAKASILLGYVIRAGFSEEAWKTYFDWRDGKIRYREALERLKRLVARS